MCLFLEFWNPTEFETKHNGTESVAFFFHSGEMHPNYKKTIENCKKEVDDLFKQYENDGTNFKQFEAKTHKDGSKIIQKQHIDDTYPKIDVCSAVICCTLKNAFDTMWSVELQPKLSESLLKAQIIDEFEGLFSFFDEILKKLTKKISIFRRKNCDNLSSA